MSLDLQRRRILQLGMVRTKKWDDSFITNKLHVTSQKAYTNAKDQIKENNATVAYSDDYLDRLLHAAWIAYQ